MEELAEFGRWLDESRAKKGSELWAAIEKPQGRIVDFLLDHGVVVYPVNPKARGSGSGPISHELCRRAILLMPMYWQNFSGPIMGICGRLSPTKPATRPGAQNAQPR